MNKVELDFEFSLNSPEAKAEAEQVKKAITGVGDTAEQQAKRVEANLKKIRNTPASQSQFNLQTKLEDAKNAAFTEKNTVKLVEYNRTIERTEAEINKLKNAGKAGFDDLGNSISKTTNVAGKAFSGLRMIANILPGIGLAGLLGFAIEPLLKYISQLDVLGAKKKEISALSFDSSEYKNAAKNVAELSANIDSANQGYISKNKVVEDYNNTIGKSAGKLNTFNEVENWQKQHVDEYLTMIQMKAEAQAFLSVSIDKATEAAKRQTIGATFGDYTTSAIKNIGLLASGSANGGWKSLFSNIVADADMSAYSSSDNSKKESKDAFETYKNKLIEAQKYAKEHKLKFDVDKDQPNNFKQLLNQEEALQKRISEIKDKYFRKSLDKDAEARQAINDEFKKLLIDIDAQNKKYDEFVKKYGTAKAENLLGKKIDVKQFEPIRKKAIEDLTYEQDTAKLAIKLTADKKLYEDFEAYKTALGTEKAKARFAGQLNTEQTYLQKLQADYAIFYAQGSVGGFTAPVQERLNFVQKQIDLEKQAEQKKQDDLLKSLISYSEERKLITEKYNKDLLDVGDNKEALDELKKKYKIKLDVLDDAHIKELSSYKALFAGIENLSQEQAKKVVNDVRVMLNAAVAAGSISAELAKSITDKLRQTDKAIVSSLPDKLIKIANHLDGIAGNVSSINSEFGNLISTLANVLGQFANIKKFSAEFAKEGATSEEKFAAGANLVAVGVGAATSLVGMFINAAKERKRAEDEYYASVIKHQNDYNLSLNEEIRLRTELSDNLFVKDLKGRIVDGTAALVDANAKYLKSIEELNGGKAKLGQRNAVDAKTLIGGAGSGAILGAAIGSVVPVIGTAIGAIVGGIAGFIGGLFGGKKKKDIFGGLLQEYPELLQKATDGTVKFNEALAKSLIANNLVDDKTKALLENTIALAEARKAALEQINSVITDLAGNLGTDLRNTLVNAFKEGEDSALAFGKTVESVLENIVSQMLFAAVFGDSFDQLEKEMKASYDIGGDGSFVDDITRFFSQAGPNIDAFNRGLEAAKEEAARNGLNIFGSSKTKEATGLTGAIRKELTEEGASILAGVIRNSNEVEKQNLAVNKEHSNLLKENTAAISDGLELIREQHLEQLQIIATNTGDTVTELKNAIKSIDKVVDNTAPKLIPR